MKGERARDDAVERMLGRLSTTDAAANDACADAELLASWADGGLDPAASAALELHLADCARCQAIVASIARAEPEAAAAPWWRREWSIRVLVPAAAAALALGVWVTMPPSGPPSITARDQVASPTIERSGGKAARPVPPSDAAFEPAQSAAPPGDRAPVPSAAPNPADRVAQPPSALPPQPAVRLEAKAEPRQESDREAQASADLLHRLDQDPARFDARAKMAKETAAAAEERAQAAAASAGSAASSNRIASASAVPAPAPAPAAPSVADRALAEASAAAIDFASPDRAVRWRLTGAPSVERSIDHGTTWTMVPTGLSIAFRAGAAPSSTVCWLVGPGGTVLLTIDGRTWQHVPFPEPAELVSIQAVDGSTASVVTADGRTFRTSNAGRTWR